MPLHAKIGPEILPGKAGRFQAQVDARDREESAPKSADEPVQAGQRDYPASFPPQHLAKPGSEADLEQPPLFEAPSYKGSDKLKEMVALITGADSGIGRAIAILYAREGADIAIVISMSIEMPKRPKRRSKAKAGAVSCCPAM